MRCSRPKCVFVFWHKYCSSIFLGKIIIIALVASKKLATAKERGAIPKREGQKGRRGRGKFPWEPPPSKQAAVGFPYHIHTSK